MKPAKAPPIQKIGNPEPGPTLPPPPEPVPHVVPKMGGEVKPYDPVVWRVKQIELDELTGWLIPRLREKWPRLSEEGIWLWLKAAIGDRHTLFCRSKHVVGMFHCFTDALEPWPIIEEKFVRSKQVAPEEHVQLYAFVKAWGKQIAAREIRFGEDSDGPVQLHVAPSLQTMDTMVRKRTVYAVTLRD